MQIPSGPQCPYPEQGLEGSVTHDTDIYKDLFKIQQQKYNKKVKKKKKIQVGEEVEFE